ncbi:TPA: hypothetical protein U1359_000051 [Streptococcus suis]|nr:hypothetical protein [Streptococcus suis]HEM5100191.1 hypothetical protein [Streptococcus suis]HEM5114906.1 hypothetical protein [Streptococcus suis]HEO8613743.1 hypothetical protein [Streptococcus suis]
MVVPKFRVWDVHNKKMFTESELVIWNGNVYANDYQKIFKSFIEEARGLVGYNVDDKYLMQSTGLFDKNGKEIFEGDVAVYLDGDNNPIYENAVVKFGQHTNMNTIYEREPVYIGLYIEGQRGTATFDVDRMYNDCEGRLTIIGNIYENPELVEG